MTAERADHVVRSGTAREPSPALRLRAALRVARWEAARIRGLPRFSCFDVPEMPVEEIDCLPGLYEPDQLDRVLACAFGASLESEIAKLEARRFRGAQRMRYVLKDAIIAGGEILTPEERHLLRIRPIREMLSGPIAGHARATLLNSEQGMNFFGHWLRDDCALYESVASDPVLLSMQRPNYPDRHVYEEAFGQTWTEVGFAHVEELTVYRELGFNRDKADRLRRLRARLRTARTARNGGQVVYVRRGHLGRDRDRSMSNQDEVERAFAAAGIRIVEPGTDGEVLVQELLDAAVIVTIEGSQASHGVYTLADGGAVLILQPPERFYNPHHEWARLLGMRYGITVGRKDGPGFRIHPDEVFRMIDRLMAALGDKDA